VSGGAAADLGPAGHLETAHLEKSAMAPNRRDVLVLAGLAGLSAGHADARAPAPAASSPRILTARPGRVALLPAPAGETDILGYDGTMPGPELRVRQGEPFAARLVNGLDQPTTIHWHGMRLPNSMDGVPHLTQAEIPPGGSFDYAFTPQDAGTFWYHAHVRSAEQVERGLFGVLIVDEREAQPFDRDVVLALKDVLLDRDGRIRGDFDHPMPAMHDGRLGNVLTVNGLTVPVEIAVRPHERLRLRLVNASNARILPVRTEGAVVHVVALDGQPVDDPFPPGDGVVTLAPGNRADLCVDAPGAAGAAAMLVAFVNGRPIPVARLSIIATAEPGARQSPLPRPARLPANPVPARLDLARATRVRIPIEGGARMQGGGMGSAMMPGHQGHVHAMGPAWRLGGRASDGHSGQPLFRARRNQTVVLTFENRTAFPHGMHLHGHHLRPLDLLDDGVKPWLLDTVLLAPAERFLGAFVADTPGRWMLHCHMLEHAHSGMSAWFEVT